MSASLRAATLRCRLDCLFKGLLEKRMNFQAKMFNRKASDSKNKPDQILDALALQPGQSVADIGAGGGYFSLRFAEAVGDEGHVFAVEIDSELVEFIRQAAKEKRLDNVDTIQSRKIS
ncbi:MAG: methyltransferase domain-containing protein [Candidatus Bathyarchaeota archaeon]|nr:methyltransferase domain-containing protein [Candidatus Bathyarchaeota archaeon]